MIEDALISALKYLLWIVPFIILGVVLAELIMALKFVNKIMWITKPITKFAHLRKECGATFLTAFASPAAANAMLMEFYNKKTIDKKELFISSLVNSFPGIVMHWKYMLPALVPLLGVTGLIYFGVLMAVGFIKTFVVLVAGRVLLPKRNDDSEITKEKRPPVKEAFEICLRTSKKTIIKILKLMIPITIIVFILIDIGVFDMLAGYLSGAAGYFPIPADGLPVIAAQFANSIAAWTIAGNLLSEGVISSKDVVLTLMVGSVLSEIVNIRHSIPYYLGIFGAKFGMLILVIATVLRNVLTILMIIVLALWW
ncbi:MAG: nucleoside recognition protein [Candidatus Altiarchaeales archaeon A3]|nr:MAG: nucleoside recognition protein [Candidatus Altiarchaeales archaeon A3]